LKIVSTLTFSPGALHRERKKGAKSPHGEKGTIILLCSAFPPTLFQCARRRKVEKIFSNNTVKESFPLFVFNSPEILSLLKLFRMARALDRHSPYHFGKKEKEKV
jgi:hypothetical protein